MKWLIEDLKSAFQELKRGSTWLVLGLIAGFGLLALMTAGMAFQTDSMLRFLKISIASCRELSNGPIIFLFFCMIFFMLSVVATFGEIQGYFSHSRHRNYHQAKRSGLHAALWGSFALLIIVASLFLFKSNC